jgi:ABC-type phosphate transport system substrate-binding protein
MILFRILFAVFLIAALSSGQAADLFVIANWDTPDDTLTTKELQRIYYGKMTRWSNDASIIPVMLASGALQDQFIKTVLKKTPEQYRIFWRQAIFTGEGTPPRAFQTQSELTDYISEHPGSIGFTTRRDDLRVQTIIIIEP